MNTKIELFVTIKLEKFIFLKFRCSFPAALQLDLAKHNSQYPSIDIHRIRQVHDRFLLIDGHELYHIGASIKDLGKRWVAFSRMVSLAAEVMARQPMGKATCSMVERVFTPSLSSILRTSLF